MLEDCKNRLETLTYNLIEETLYLENRCRDLKSDYDNLSNEKEHALKVVLKENKKILMNDEKLNTLINTLKNNHKHLKDNNIEYDKHVIVSDLSDLKSECDCNNKTIMNLTAEKVTVIRINDKLSEMQMLK